MKQITLKVELTEAEVNRMRERYHFEKKDESRLYRMYEMLLSFIRAEAWYKVCGSGEIDGIAYEKYAVVLVTLSEFTDRLIELEGEAGNISDAYMLDCIALELLAVAYQQVADKIYEETHLWQAGYEFPGDSLPLELIPVILDKLSGVPVHLNQAGMMIPAKSVVYLTKLVEERQKSSCHICENCRNLTCPNRQEKSKKELASAALDDIRHANQATQLSYGYQRIFGGKTGWSRE